MAADERLLHIASAPFEAARMLAGLPAGHRAGRLHGHSFMATVRVEFAEAIGRVTGTEVQALQARLAECVAPLDYRYLNEALSVPSDENLAHWIRDRLGVQGIETVRVRSTRRQGVDLGQGAQVHVWRRFRFEAAHRLPNVRPGHPCGRMHGHGFEVILHATPTAGGIAQGADHDLLERAWQPLQRTLHHACLNEIPGLENPTSELLAHWIWQRLKPGIAALSWVTVQETATAGCHYDGRRYRIWKEQAFEAALRLPKSPDGDARQGLHGHSYLLRLHLVAPLDEVLGWTVDYGDVKERFRPFYDCLDHRIVNDIEAMHGTGAAAIAAWASKATAATLHEIDRIDVYETPGCGVALQKAGHDPILPV